MSCKNNTFVEDFYKRLSRNTIHYKGGRVSLTRTRNLYLNSHLSKSDLGFLSDFDTFKLKLDIVNKQFLTITPVKHTLFNVHVRDTMLLAPAASKSLDEIGKMYGAGYCKVVIDPA